MSYLRKIRIQNYGRILLGNLLLALSVRLFLLPSGLISGGTTGLALVVSRASGLAVSTFVLIFNGVMLAAALLFLGKDFVADTILSSITYPLFLKFLEHALPDTAFTGSLLLSSLLAGLGMGSALGLIIGAGASSGGMDIPPLVIRKYFRIPVSVSMYFFDVLIVFAQAVGHSPSAILCGFLLILVNALTLHAVLHLRDERKRGTLIPKDRLLPAR